MAQPSPLQSENCASRKNSAYPNRNFAKAYLLIGFLLVALASAFYVPIRTSGAQTFQTIRNSAPPGLDSSIRSSTDQKRAPALVEGASCMPSPADTRGRADVRG